MLKKELETLVDALQEELVETRTERDEARAALAEKPKGKVAGGLPGLVQQVEDILIDRPCDTNEALLVTRRLQGIVAQNTILNK